MELNDEKKIKVESKVSRDAHKNLLYSRNIINTEAGETRTSS